MGIWGVNGNEWDFHAILWRFNGELMGVDGDVMVI